MTLIHWAIIALETAVSLRFVGIADDFVLLAFGLRQIGHRSVVASVKRAPYFRSLCGDVIGLFGELGLEKDSGVGVRNFNGLEKPQVWDAGCDQMGKGGFASLGVARHLDYHEA